MLAPGYIGIKVTSGEHKAVFVYKAPWFRTPLMIIGILVLLALYYSKRLNTWAENLRDR